MSDDNVFINNTFINNIVSILKTFSYSYSRSLTVSGFSLNLRALLSPGLYFKWLPLKVNKTSLTVNENRLLAFGIAKRKKIPLIVKNCF